MSLINNYFNKNDIEEITYEDLTSFFSVERQENDKLEFKSFAAEEGGSIREKVNGIIRTISAFLNSDGGVLIWGAPEGRQLEDRNEKVFLGDLSTVTEFYEKDQFISKITDSITPAPKGILFHRIECEEGYAYLFEVPKGEYAPHQFGHKFHMRIDGQTKPAPYHYVEALFKKVKNPNLQGFVRLENWQYQQNVYRLHLTLWFFNLTPLLNDYDLTYRLICNNGTFSNWDRHNLNNDISFDNAGHQKRVLNVKNIFHYGEPVFQQESIEFSPANFQNRGLDTNLVLSFGAKNSPMKMSTYKIRLSIDEPNDLNTWIIEKEENKQLNKDKTYKRDLEQIEEILGREI